MSKPILHLKFTENGKFRGDFLTDKTTFHIGSDLYADYFCLLDDLPPRYPLFKKSGKSYLIQLPGKASGEIVKDGSKVDIQSLKNLGFIQRKNGYLFLPVERGQFGAIEWDGLVVDFDYRYTKVDFRDKLALIKKQQNIDKKRRETLFRKVERVFILILFLSALIHATFGLFIYMAYLPPLKIISVDQVSKRFARLVLEPPKKVKTSEPVKSTQKIADATVGAEEKEGKAGKKKNTKKKKKSGAKKQGAKSGGDGKKAGGKKDGKKDVSSLGVLGVITASSGSDDNTAISNLQAMGIAKKVETAFGKSNKGGGGGDGEGWGEGDGFPFIASYGDGEYGDVVDEEPVGGRASSVKLKRAGDISFDDPSEVAGEGSASAFRTPDAIRKAIMSQMEGIRFCFNKSLKQNSQISGKVVLEFTILAKGSVQNVSILTSSLSEPSLESCILDVVKRWRFQPISAGDVDVNYPLIFTPRN
ncbi:MAG: hypothetical protein B6244_02465 [Candidatus Cloacimonetes bacterium 4572_55]|nr:MAG: hypothetical protein B6244_02465 [Candidatus Cloacimonetes bacterium 4572_55]